jgi:quercetin dioxygenase-like cupin family protein
MKIIRSGSVPSAPGPEAYFTGRVRLDSPFQTDAPARVGGAIVTFEPGRARPGTPIRWVRR